MDSVVSATIALWGKRDIWSTNKKLEDTKKFLTFAGDWFKECFTIDLGELIVEYDTATLACDGEEINNLDFGISNFFETYGGRCCVVVNKTRWFVFFEGVITEHSAIINDDGMFYRIELSTPKPALFSDIHFPEEISEAFYGSLCKLPKRRKLTADDVVTFVDVNLTNPPIILPKWVVLKYCHPKYATGNTFFVTIPLTQIIADAIMNLFEHNTKPKRLTVQQLGVVQEVCHFLTN